MEPSEVEFIAEQQLVTIIPNFSENKICLISGDFGPFNPSMQTKVPLWLAINLRQRHKCRIECPSWLTVDALCTKKTEEQESTTFTHMSSPHYLEEAMLLLNNAADDIPRADEVRTLVKDLWDLRMAKLRRSVNQMISENATHAQLDGLTPLEICSTQPFLRQALDHLLVLNNNQALHQGSSQMDSTL